MSGWIQNTAGQGHLYHAGIQQKASPGNSSTILIAFSSQLFDGFHYPKKKDMQKSVKKKYRQMFYFDNAL